MSGLDLVIRGGTVIDGTGAKGSLADVGIKATIVGGKLLIENGATTGALPGQLLRRRD